MRNISDWFWSFRSFGVHGFTHDESQSQQTPQRRVSFLSSDPQCPFLLQFIIMLLFFFSFLIIRFHNFFFRIPRFVSNLTGSSLLEICALATLVPVCFTHFHFFFVSFFLAVVLKFLFFQVLILLRHSIGSDRVSGNHCQHFHFDLFYFLIDAWLNFLTYCCFFLCRNGFSCFAIFR